MKWLMLTLLMTINLHGMAHLIDYVRMVYQYDLPTEGFQLAMNQVIHGRTMLDVIYTCWPVDAEFVEYLRLRGARRSEELPTQPSLELLRAQRLLNHIVPDIAL